MTNTVFKTTRQKTLTCSVCGQHTVGKQWWNRDTGYGICPRCATIQSKKLTKKEMSMNYGKLNIHYKLERIQNEIT